MLIDSDKKRLLEPVSVTSTFKTISVYAPPPPFTLAMASDNVPTDPSSVPTVTVYTGCEKATELTIKAKRIAGKIRTFRLFMVFVSSSLINSKYINFTAICTDIAKAKLNRK